MPSVSHLYEVALLGYYCKPSSSTNSTCCNWRLLVAASCDNGASDCELTEGGCNLDSSSAVLRMSLAVEFVQLVATLLRMPIFDNRHW